MKLVANVTFMTPQKKISMDNIREKISAMVDKIKNGNLTILESEQLLLSFYGTENKKICSRCGQKISTGWEQSSCNFDLSINIDCQSTQALFGDESNIGFDHPAIAEKSNFQHLHILSGGDNNYRLCCNCHRDFVRMVGNFLKVNKHKTNDKLTDTFVIEIDNIKVNTKEFQFRYRITQNGVVIKYDVYDSDHTWGDASKMESILRNGRAVELALEQITF